jgi:hypothetical protein
MKNQERKKERQHKYHHQPTDHGDPVLLRFKYIDSGEGFGPKLPGRRYNQVAVFIFPTI